MSPAEHCIVEMVRDVRLVGGTGCMCFLCCPCNSNEPVFRNLFK